MGAAAAKRAPQGHKVTLWLRTRTSDQALRQSAKHRGVGLPAHIREMALLGDKLAEFGFCLGPNGVLLRLMPDGQMEVWRGDYAGWESSPGNIDHPDKGTRDAAPGASAAAPSVRDEPVPTAVASPKPASPSPPTSSDPPAPGAQSPVRDDTDVVLLAMDRTLAEWSATNH